MSSLEQKVRTFGCFDQVAKVIGEEKAVVELVKVVECEHPNFIGEMRHATLIDLFVWELTPQGHKFWQAIDDGKNPYIEAAGENKGEGV